MDILHFVVSSYAVDLVGPDGLRVEEKSICIGEPPNKRKRKGNNLDPAIAVKRFGAADSPRLEENRLCLNAASRAR
jgi:hypothetical protein